MRKATVTRVSSMALATCALHYTSALRAQDSTPPQASAETATAAAAPSEGEIIVSARRRAETLTSVPLAVNAIDQRTLTRMGVNDFHGLADALPNLKISESVSGLGGSIYVRGVGTTSATNGSFDQAVSVNVDGVQFSRANILRLGLYDAAQVQVLRGPQALFFGKNSPAGVIAITTADPTDKFEASTRASYEFNSREKLGEAMVSGPLTDTLGARLVLDGQLSDGWLKNDAYKTADAINAIRPGTVFATPGDRAPHIKSWFARGTLKFAPSDQFDARAKFTYSHLQQDGVNDIKQKIVCPNGVSNVANTVAALGGNPALGPLLAIDDCHADNHFTHGPVSPAAAAVAGRSTPNDLLGSQLATGVLEANYKPSTQVTLTSVTGYSWTLEDFFDDASWNPAYLPSVGFSVHTRERSFTQEVRMITNFTDFPVNFLFGGFYQDANLFLYAWNAGTNAARFNQYIGTKAKSVYGQAIWNVTPTVELSGGVRYSSETKTFDLDRDGVPQPTQVPRRTFNNASPEATLTYRPSRQATFYASYKTGFKSGGFAASYNVGPPLTPPGDDKSYRPEVVRGGEVGAKGELFDRSLILTLAGYNYKYRDLQVSSIDNTTGAAVIRVTNAASARVKGIEFEAGYTPQSVQGLRLNAAIYYNDARFRTFISPCYTGETIAEGCNLNLTAGQFRSQNLAGYRLPNSSALAMSYGANYEFDLNSSGLMAGLAADTKYQSKYNPLAEQDPLTVQNAFWLVNGSIRLFPESRKWEMALIGRNLTNVYRAVEVNSASLTGIGARTGTNTVGGRPDYTGNLIRGRQIMLQASLRY